MNWTNLPPAVPGQIDFDRDVQPILNQSCLRCHGPEKPKSHFRLDTRDAALKGGDENKDDILPGDSADSRLIHYVTRLVPDMEMPPEGKGDALTAEQIGILRAWIDEGAHWSASNSFPQTMFSFSPTLRWIAVDGDKHKFREIENAKEGWGGSDEFSFQEKLSPDEMLSVDGHVAFPERDIRVRVALGKNELGFIRGGFETWRKYYDDTGGFYPGFTPPSLDLNRDLHVDSGRAWFDAGLTLPNWPQIVFGYEYQFKNGAKSMLDWGYANGKDVYPATKTIDEQTHIIKLDVTHDFAGWHLEDSARVEFNSDATRGNEGVIFAAGTTPDALTRTDESYHHVQGMNSLLLEKQLRDWWFLSGGYYYSRLEASDFFHQTNSDAANNPFLVWNSGRITLSRESHIFSAASILTPIDGLSLSLDSQNEWTREEGSGNVPDFDLADSSAPPLFARANFDRFKAMQTGGLRFTKIPFTVLFADAHFEEEELDELQQESGGGSPDEFIRRTAASNFRRDLRTGFSASPWRWAALSAEYRSYASDTDYHHFLDQSAANGLYPNGDGYPAFIRARTIRSDEVEAKLTLRPARWLKTTFTYRISATDYRTTTDSALGFDPSFNLVVVSPGGHILAGNYDAQTYGASITLVPFQRFYFSGTFTYSQSRTLTPADGSGSVVPYEGDIYSVLASGTYALNARTELQATYSFSQSGFGQHNPGSVPLGLNYTRHSVSAGISHRWTNRVSSNLRYSFYRYAEPSTGGLNDFTAHGVFATVVMSWR